MRPGATEILIVLLIVFILFGAKRLPELGRSLGQGMREFKNSVRDNDKGDQDDQGAKTDKAEESDQGQAALPPTNGSGQEHPTSETVDGEIVP